jgi:hypothetical protein
MAAENYTGGLDWMVQNVLSGCRSSYCYSRVDLVWKVRDRKQITNIRKYSFVNRTIKTGTNHL